MSAREVAWVLASALLHALWNVVAKRTPRPTAFLFLLTALTALATVPLCFFIPFAEVSSELAWLMLASMITHGLSFVTLSRAYEAGDLSVVYPISRSTPLVVPLLSVPLLGEHLSILGGMGIGLAVIGLWLVQTEGKLSLRALRTPAALWAYLMLLLTALFSVIDKRAMVLLSQLPWHSPVPATAIFYGLFTAGSALVALPFALSRVGTKGLYAELGERGKVILLCTVVTGLSYVIILEVLRSAPVSYVVAVRQSSVLFAVAMAMWTLGERPGRARILGALGSVLGIVLIALGS